MAKKFSRLRANMSAEAQAKSSAKAQEMLNDMPLQELRLARGLSQQNLAEVLGVQQPAVAKMEKRTDMYISTLRSHIRAMGGELKIVACFADGDVTIQNFVIPDEEPLGSFSSSSGLTPQGAVSPATDAP